MKGPNLFRLILTVLLGIAAFSMLQPFQTTPYADYLIQRTTEHVGPEGSVLSSRDERRAELQELIDRAQVLVDEYEGPDDPYPSIFAALQEVALRDNVDLAYFFKDLVPRLDTNNVPNRNRIVLTHLYQESQSALHPGLDLAGGIAVVYEVPIEQLSDQPGLRMEQMNDVRRVLLDRIDAYGVAEPVVRLRDPNQIEVQLAGAENSNLLETLSKPAKLEFKLTHPSLSPGLAERPMGYEEAIYEREDRRSGEIDRIPVFLQRIPVMDGSAISESQPALYPSGGYFVQLSLTDQGRQLFADTTETIARTGQQMAIILDGKIVSLVGAQERIDSPSAIIEGGRDGFSQREAFNLANSLDNPLSVELDLAESYRVDASLAKESQNASLQAAMWGGLLVVLFMIYYYWAAGLVAMLSVALNLLLVIGALASFDATITLPGVTALVLTIGMAVDANILIFERIREELNAGKSMANAVKAGFEKAFSTIVDANTTTLITALILLSLGTGPVKGFGVTLSLGIIATVFSSLVASRWMLDLCAQMGWLKGAFTPRFVTRWLEDRHIPFLDFRKYAMPASWALVVLGVGAFILHFDKAFGIDFTGGDELTITHQQPIADAEIEALSGTESFVNEAGETVLFDEVNVGRQTPLGTDQELLVIQTPPDQGEAFFAALQAAYPQAELELVGTTQIGAAVGKEVTQGALTSMGLAIMAMLLYIAVRFEFGYGFGAIIASLHDIGMTIGLFFVFGEFFGLGTGQFTAPMIAAVLMTVGYSINDTIVVFDRIREELDLNPGLTLRQIVHRSINLVLNRTLLTSATTLFAALVLFLFGAGVIQDFALVFILGILTGTFSSLFIASPMFYLYHKGSRASVEASSWLPSYDWQDDPSAAPKKAVPPTEPTA